MKTYNEKRVNIIQACYAITYKHNNVNKSERHGVFMIQLDLSSLLFLNYVCHFNASMNILRWEMKQPSLLTALIARVRK